MSKRRQHNELVWLPPHAGFGPGMTYAIPIPEVPFPFNPRWQTEERFPASRQERLLEATVWATENPPCLLECGDPDCREWTNVWLLPGQDRTQAVQNIIQRRYSGASYHVSECQMLDDRFETGEQQEVMTHGERLASANSLFR